MDYIMLLVTFPNKEEATAISQYLLEKKLIACANCVEHISSHFWWEGRIDVAQETLMIAKSEKSLFPQIQTLIKEKHSYDVPEIIAIPIVCGSQDYLQWISESVNSDSST